MTDGHEYVFYIQTLSFFLINAVLLLFGLARKYFAESGINDIVGYRTARSMKSQETWREAHLYFGRLITAISLILIAASYWLLQLKMPYAILISLVGLFLAAAITELHLSRKFPDQ